MAVSIDLTGKVGIVTGAGQGIGRATALRLAEAGADVVIAELVLERGEAVAAEARGLGRKALAVRTDVTAPDSTKAMVQAALDTFGHVDILVNNAARWTTKLFKDLTPEEYDLNIEVALYGTLHCSRAVLDPMSAQKYGKIVNLISDAGRIGEPYLTVYSAAKGGVAAFTKALAKEVGRFNITVNGVAPGITETPGSAEFIEGAGGGEKLAKAYPIRRIGQPMDIANAILFFSSDLSSWVTGQIISVSGGYTTVG
ncbi:MAG: short-chain dehydrogenase [Chloroflexi bacterium RBG_16_57_9]|nr:MAG: short-chain dehydrogenase [Chloroflexi bacterium RBG_16_57_9]